MTFVGIRRVAAAPALALFLAAASAPAQAAAPADPTVARGIAYLKGAGVRGTGESALAALAMLKADVPHTDPALAALLDHIHKRFGSEGYQPELQGGPDVYEAAVVAMVLANLDAETRRDEVASIARYLIGRQKANGSWDYDARTYGDTSISQYAVLGLWEASSAGADVPVSVFDRAAGWYMSTQRPDGGWMYHGDEEGRGETISMTAAGVGSLLICQRQLAQYREMTRGEAPSKLLTALTAGPARTEHEIANGPTKTGPAVKRGLAWLAGSFTTSSQSQIIGPSVYYGLYGIERIGALADRETLGRIDWFEQGRRFIASSQQPDGSWSSTHGEVPNTAWALLFIVKSTSKTLQRIEIKRLGAGTLLGGRGLPRDLSSLTVAGGRVVSRPMSGAVESMLAVLEDPRSQEADSALAGLVARFQAEGPGVLKPLKDRFRRLLADRDGGLRQVAAWALARTDELDVVPDLAGALVDDDAAVVESARLGLQLVSRKIEGFGPPAGATAEQKQEAARRWRQWYARTRPLEVEGQDDEK
jgi:prenyltransferase beta subunit